MKESICPKEAKYVLENKKTNIAKKEYCTEPRNGGWLVGVDLGTDLVEQKRGRAEVSLIYQRVEGEREREREKFTERV